ncbi:MAG TPA: chromate transporter [Bacillota bacterium]|jgi:chromate transporter|nr:chromate transporter [Bacillota bacterium]HPZ53567.1 chromate transporter [Bacillota bacterium]HQD17128.1 chromate transporter [Bacillota bacterium]
MNEMILFLFSQTASDPPPEQSGQDITDLRRIRERQPNQQEGASIVALLWQIYTSFFRVGLFTIGGGYAMLPMFEREIIKKRGWIDQDRLLDIYAAAQSLPGAIALNSATFIGNIVAGVPGAISALLGVATPSIAIIIVVAEFLSRIIEVPIAMYALKGMSAAVVALIADAAIRLGMRSIRTPITLVLALASLVLVVFVRISSVRVILGAVVLGTAYSWLSTRFEQHV